MRPPCCPTRGCPCKTPVTGETLAHLECLTGETLEYLDTCVSAVTLAGKKGVIAGHAFHPPIHRDPASRSWPASPRKRSHLT